MPEQISSFRYIRISPKPEENREVLAVDRQRAECIAKEQRLGWTCVAEYVDQHVSASSKKPRPEYERMLADMEAGKAQAVIAWSLDRLHRKPVELERFIDVANAKNMALATCQGDIDISQPDGRFMARTIGNVAKFEMEQKSRRQKAMHTQRIGEGKLWFSVRPFGYRVVGKMMVEPCPIEAPVVHRVYADVIAGASLYALSRGLNADGVKTSKGKEWTPQHLRQMLLSPRYAGKQTYQGQELAVSGWPALVSVEDWQAANGRLRSHPTAGQPANSAAKWLVSGIARCGVAECGGPMRVVPVGGAQVYRCALCLKVSAGQPHLDALVTETLLARLSQPDAASVFLHDRGTPDYGRQQAVAAEARSKLDGLVLAFTSGVIDAEQLKVGSADLRTQLARAEAAVSSTRTTSLLGPLLNSDPRAVWKALPMDRQRAVLRECVTIAVHPAKRGANRFDPARVSIDWKVAA